MLRGEGGDTRLVGRVRAGAACRDAESAGEAAVLRRLGQVCSRDEASEQASLEGVASTHRVASDDRRSGHSSRLHRPPAD